MTGMLVDQRLTSLHALTQPQLPPLSLDQRAWLLTFAARIELLLADEETVLPGWDLDRVLTVLAPDVAEGNRRFLFTDLIEAQRLVDSDPVLRALDMGYGDRGGWGRDRAEQTALNDRDSALWALLHPGFVHCPTCRARRPLLAANPVRPGERVCVDCAAVT